MGKYALADKAVGKNVPASTKRGMDRTGFSLREGYCSSWREIDYGGFGSEYYGSGEVPFSLGKQRCSIPERSMEEMKREAGNRSRGNNREPSYDRQFEKKEPKTETIATGKNGRLFELDEILCIEAHDLGMFPGAEHPFIQETFAKNDYDILKARNELARYFRDGLWLRVAPYIYVKKEDAGKPLRQLAQNAGKENRSVKPEDFGLVLHPSARWMLESVQGDRMQFIWELEPMLSKLPTGIDWQEAEAVMQFLNAFSVNAFFYQLKEMRNSVIQDVIGGRLDAALKAAEKMDCAQDRGMALCWIIMGHLNNGNAGEAAALLEKMVRMPRDKMDWVSQVKAAGLLAIYYNKAGLKEEAEKCFAPLEKMLENGYGAMLLIEWQARAGLEGAAIQNLLKYANNYESQDALFEMLSKIKPFEINPKDFEIR